jgi:preprotein translocase subunit SecE
MSKVSNFFIGIKKEMEKVKWPSKKEMVKYSITTIIFIIFFALFFFSLDLIFAYLKSLVS